MAGLFPLSLQQIHDDFGRPVKGALSYFYEAATLDPLPVFTDYNCQVPGPNPWPADGFGRLPAIYLDQPLGGSGFYRFRITTAEGAVIPGLDLQILPVIGPSVAGGGGGGPPVDATALAVTGDFVFTVRWTGSPARAGWVRANGNTIGHAASGASEFAGDACLALYQHIWSNTVDAACPVSGGRGANATADYNAHKRLTLPDLRGRAPYGVDRMGNGAGFAGRLTSATITAAGLGPDITGSYGGFEQIILGVGTLPAHSHPVDPPSVTSGPDLTNHNHSAAFATAIGGGSSGVVSIIGSGLALNTSIQQQTHTHSIDIPSFLSGNAGGGGAHSNLAPALLGSWYIKQ